jgi:hypothetical protein
MRGPGVTRATSAKVTAARVTATTVTSAAVAAAATVTACLGHQAQRQTQTNRS